MLDFLFLPFFRKFTQEIYTRARKTNTQIMRDDGDAAEAATPSQLEVTPAPDKRKKRESTEEECARERVTL